MMGRERGISSYPTFSTGTLFVISKFHFKSMPVTPTKSGCRVGVTI